MSIVDEGELAEATLRVAQTQLETNRSKLTPKQKEALKKLTVKFAADVVLVLLMPDDDKKEKDPAGS